ncbi:hypothetical protein HQ393_12680 [Chitinibacter bivalviorum]|uniref:Uncharacterized protein n=1 Tax=Chitinibacter bivalviorum TaxID=2739434 RepID=A0A7H9BNK1_9NEIS|nr:hypothetical protein HQ393_12680 [Chitinibacter bivalviorum]
MKPATPQSAVKAATKPAAATQPKPAAAKAASRPVAKAPASKALPKPVAAKAPAAPAVAKPVAKTLAKVDAPAASPAVEKKVAALKVEKPVRTKKTPKKAKLVRDSFTFPESDYALIAATKQRVIAAGVEVKKSELIRAGLLALSAMDDVKLLALVNSLEKIKTGRPSKK